MNALMHTPMTAKWRGSAGKWRGIARKLRGECAPFAPRLRGRPRQGLPEGKNAIFKGLAGEIENRVYSRKKSEIVAACAVIDAGGGHVR